MNCKEFIRQISELDEGDFSLLECAVGELLMNVGSGGGAVGYSDYHSCEQTHLLHIGLEAEDLEDISVAEQLDTILERLRADGKGRVSTDSGAVSDLESLSVTTLEEDYHQRKGANPQPPSSGDKSSRGRVELSGKAGEDADSDGVNNSSVCGLPVVHHIGEKGGVISEEAGVISEETRECMKEVHRTNRQCVREGEKGVSRWDAETSTAQKVVRKPSSSKEMTQTKITERKSRLPRVEVVVLHHKRDNSEQNPREKTPPMSTQQPQQTVTAEVAEKESSSSPTEGGPFITHWGKGRWKRGNNRDYRNRRTYNSQQQNYQPRQRYGNTQGVNRSRYQSARGYSAHNTSNKYTTLNGIRGETSHSKSRESFERDKSQRDQQPPVQPTSTGTHPEPDSPAPLIHTTAQTRSQAAAPLPEKPTQLKPSYASVTGSVGRYSGTNVAVKPPQPSLAASVQNAPVASEQKNTHISTETTKQNTSIPIKQNLYATTEQDTSSEKDTSVPNKQNVSTEKNTSNPTKQIPSLATEQNTSIPNLFIEKSTSISSEPSLATKQSISSEWNRASKQNVTEQSASDDSSGLLQDIAASFNYSEVVEFLKKGEPFICSA